jgi:perosamine synthetase
MTSENQSKIDEFIPQFKPWFDEKERQALNQYMLDGGYITEFKKTRDFAQAIADFTGSKYCSILSNGTVTMTAALIAMGIGSGDEVIVPDYTMIATANAVLMAGAQPVFCDVENKSMCIDFEGLKSAITPRTKAVMLVSINGRYPSQIVPILDYCKSKGIRVVEDAAQSLGSYYKGIHVGTYGEIGSFSFSMPKIVTTGQGGALVTNSEELYRKIELVRNFGRESAGVDKHIFFGVNFKFTDLQAVIGIEQMKKLPERIRLKKRTFRTLQDRLGDVPQVEFIETSNEVTPWFNDILVKERDSLQLFLKNKMVGSRPFYPALHTQAPYNLPPGLHPIAESLAEHGLWLPSYAQLTEAEIDRIVSAIREFYGK